MKKTHLIGILVIAIAIAAIISTFSDSSSYASFAESKETNKEIHVVGKLQKEKEMVYNPIQDANYFSFYVKDQQGEECKVIYAGTKPQDFEKSEQIVLIGDNKKMVTALVVPSFAKLREWAKQNGTEYTSNESIIQNATVLSTFESIIAEYNLLFNQVEQVKKFTLLPRELTIDQGEMTPKLSIRRKQVLANFEKEIDLMYQG